MPFIILLLTALIGSINPSGNSKLGGLIPPSSTLESCKATLQDSWMWVSIDPDKKGLYGNREEKVWRLVKTNAPIPAWKVNYPAGEMEVVGKVKDATESYLKDKEVFIGVGHCPKGNPWPEKPTGCTDPLVANVLFVAVKPGAKTPLPPWAVPTWAPTPGTDEQGRSAYWWEFHVYVNAELLPANATNADLPCWMNMVCDVDLRRSDVSSDCRNWLAQTECGKHPENSQVTPPVNCAIVGSKVLGVTSASSGTAPAFVAKRHLNCLEPAACDKLQDFYLSSGTAMTHANYKIGTYPANGKDWSLWYAEAEDILYLGDSSPFYLYIPNDKLFKPTGVKALQLGTFDPSRKFSYEWWTPACKPAIYLYPPNTTDLMVKIKPEGRITTSIPEHGDNGWSVRAYPEGKIECNNETISQCYNEGYPYLYYETELTKVKVPELGWYLGKKDIKPFFDEILPKLGLNDKEKSDFLEYWLIKLEEYLSDNNPVSTHNYLSPPKLFVSLIDNEELNRVEPIEFSVKPDNFLRVRFYFEKLSSLPITDLPTEALAKKGNQLPTTYSSNRQNIDLVLNQLGILPLKSRIGFTAVDWGGILEGGSCGVKVKDY